MYLNYNDIDIEIVDSDTHSWNRVKIDEKWYFVDLTWDAKNQDKLDYCLKTKEVFSEDHKFDKVKDTDENISYAQENYNSEIVQQTMDKVSEWTQIKDVLAKIDQEKHNNLEVINNRRIKISGVNKAISNVNLSDLQNVQKVLEGEKHKEEYERE